MELPYIDPILQSQIPRWKNDVLKKDKDKVIIVDGREGCLTGDTLIKVSRMKASRTYTIKQIFERFNKTWDKKINANVRSYDGKEIRLHKMIGATYSGKKEVYELILENGKKIKATADHRFMTRNGWKRLDLLGGEEVMCDQLNALKSGRIRIKLYDVQLKVPKHPYASASGRVEIHRLIYEAVINNLPFLEYLDVLLNDSVKDLKFVDTNLDVIHHKDGNHYNNDIKNLEKISKDNHLKLHGDNNYKNFGQMFPVFSKVKQVKYSGVEDTYDLQCEEPYHNFVANGMVVHNSGKSALAQQLAIHLDPTFNIDKITFTAEEFMKKLKEPTIKKGDCIILDEAFLAANSRSAMSSINKAMVGLATEMRQLNLFIIICLPSFFDLDKYFALWRTDMLIHTYFDKNGDRGRFIMFGSSKKKNLYLYGKKYYNYSATKSPYPACRFRRGYTVDEDAYRLKKQNAFRVEKVSKVNERYKRDLGLIYEHLRNKFGYTWEQIGEVLDKTESAVREQNIRLEKARGAFSGVQTSTIKSILPTT